MTELEKMCAGIGYNPFHAELTRLRVKAHILSQQYNATFETDIEQRNRILAELLPDKGENCYIVSP